MCVSFSGAHASRAYQHNASVRVIAKQVLYKLVLVFKPSFSFSLFANLNSTREESEGYLPAPGLWCFETGGPMPNAKIQL